MSKKIITLFVLLCAFAALAFSAPKKETPPLSSLTPEQIQQIQATTWRVELKSDIKNLRTNAVQFAIFDTDPLPLLKTAREQRAVTNAGKNLTDFEKQIDMELDWDSIFRAVTGSDVFLINAKTGTKESHIISGDIEGNTKWLVTKTAPKKDGSFSVWIIPFIARIGETQVITLTEKNAFDTSPLQIATN